MIRPEIISEVGVAHEGSFNRALEYIQVSKQINANIVKFQMYYPDILCADRNCPDAYPILNRVKMHPSWIRLLAEECERLNLEFLCTSFCKYSAEEIAPYVKRFKIASPEVAKLPFLKHVASYGKPLILSTGKVNDEQLDKIFETIDVPITLLVCKSLYPAKVSDYDLNEIDRLRDKYKTGVGLSDHTKGLKLSIDSVDHGAVIIERHIMLSRKVPDEPVSLFPDDFAKLIQIINDKTEDL